MHTLSQLREGSLNGTTYLKLSEGLKSFPQEIFELAETLEILDLSGNELTSLPDDLGKLHKLRILFCSNNPFTILPEALGDCPHLEMVGFKANKIETVPAGALNTHLRWLILTDNNITELPAAIGLCSRMEKLMLAGNKLHALPTELQYCQNLALLRISANKLQNLPDWLLSMPKLSWLAFSGNPFCITPQIPTIPSVSWHQLEIQQTLGQGASGIIYRANLLKEHRRVAVKVFKGAVTSDGLPEDEMNAFISAGTHAGLVKLIAELKNHPDERKGLLMELIPDDFQNLGMPPNFETCTRDVFDTTTTLTSKSILKIASTIASLVTQLHQNGIMHGDLYAHNILVNKDNDTLLSDFGAASFYNKQNKQYAENIEQLEVRAFGILLDDLLHLCSETSAITEHLIAIRNSCLQYPVSGRPSFATLQDTFKCIYNKIIL
jgi:hypothetical protein